MSHIVVITSKDCLEYFPLNSACCFQVKLPQAMPFASKNYEVSLLELSIILNRKEYYFTVEASGKQKKIEVCRESSSVEDLISSLNKSLSPDARKFVRFDFDTLTERCSVAIKEGVKVKLSENLREALGFSVKTLTHLFTEGTDKISRSSSDFKTDDLCVLCDAVKPQILRSKFVKFLRVFTDVDFTQTISFKNFKPFFIPIEHKSFDVIRFSLCHTDGSPVKINGTTVLTLQFRPRKH